MQINKKKLWEELFTYFFSAEHRVQEKASRGYTDRHTDTQIIGDTQTNRQQENLIIFFYFCKIREVG
jgi:hypothetical protein